MTRQFDCLTQDVVESAGVCSSLASTDCSLRAEVYSTACDRPVKAADLYNRLNVNLSRDNDDHKYLTKDELALALSQDRQGRQSLTNNERQTVELLLAEFSMVKKLSKAKGEDNDGISIMDLQIFLDRNAQRIEPSSACQRSAAMSESEYAQLYSMANVNPSSDKDDAKYLTKRELGLLLSRDAGNGGTLLNDKQRELAGMLLGQFDKAKKLSKLKGEDNDGISFYDLKISVDANRRHLESVGRAEQERASSRKPAQKECIAAQPSLPVIEIPEGKIEQPRKSVESPKADIVDLSQVSEPASDKTIAPVQPLKTVESRDNYVYHAGGLNDDAMGIFEDPELSKVENSTQSHKQPDSEGPTTPEYAAARQKEINKELERQEFNKRMSALELEDESAVAPRSLSVLDKTLLKMLDDAEAKKTEQPKADDPPAKDAILENARKADVPPIAGDLKTTDARTPEILSIPESLTRFAAENGLSVKEKTGVIFIDGWLTHETVGKTAQISYDQDGNMLISRPGGSSTTLFAKDSPTHLRSLTTEVTDGTVTKTTKVFDYQGYRQKNHEVTTEEGTVSTYNNLWRITTRNGKVYVERPEIDDAYANDDEFTPSWQNRGEGWTLSNPEEASGFDPETINQTIDLHAAGFRFWLDNPKRFWGF